MYEHQYVWGGCGWLIAKNGAKFHFLSPACVLYFKAA